MARKLETRVFTLDQVELRAASDAGTRAFHGHAAVFDVLSSELFGFYERIASGAFDRAINGEDDVRFLVNHEPSAILARTKSGTLELTKDKAGLIADAPEMPDTNAARDLAVSMDRGDIDQMSFGFRTIADSWAEEEIETKDGKVIITVRTLEECELFDVSVVTFPAYPSTDAEMNAAFRYLGAGLEPALRAAKPIVVNQTFVAKPVEPARRRLQHRLKSLLAETRDSDDVAVALLGQMIGLGSAWVDNEDEPADRTKMEELLETLEDMLLDELNEDDVAEPGEPAEPGAAAAPPGEQRAGKVLSKKNKERVAEAIAQLQALLDAAEPVEEEKSTPVEIAHRRRRLELLDRCP